MKVDFSSFVTFSTWCMLQHYNDTQFSGNSQEVIHFFSRFFTYSTDFKDSTIWTLFVKNAKNRLMKRLVPQVMRTVSP